MDSIKVFSIIITENKDSSAYPYFVEIPDLDGVIEGQQIADAIQMAKDYIGTTLLKSRYQNQIPTYPKLKATPLQPS